MTNKEERPAGCVLRLFGAPEQTVQKAVEALPDTWQGTVHCRSRGAETLVALQSSTPQQLHRAVQQSADKPCPGAVRGRGADPCRCRSAGAGTAPQAAGVQRCRRRGAAGDPTGKPSRRGKGVRFWCYELRQCRAYRPAQPEAAQSAAGRACPHTGAGAGHAADDRCCAGGGLCGTAPKPSAAGGQQKGLLAAVRAAGREPRPVAAGYAAPRRLRSAAGWGHMLAVLRQNGAGYSFDPCRSSQRHRPRRRARSAAGWAKHWWCFCCWHWQHWLRAGTIPAATLPPCPKSCKALAQKACPTPGQGWCERCVGAFTFNEKKPSPEGS